MPSRAAAARAAVRATRHPGGGPMMAKIGYARVSTRGQNDDSQVDDLTACGCEKIFTDTASGKHAARPELDKALAYLRKGDVFVITRLSRAMRSLKHLLALADELRERGVGLVVLKQQIDTTTPQGRLVFHLLGAIDEFQRELIVEGTREGLAAARARGAAPAAASPSWTPGRPPPSAACTPLPARTASGCTRSPRSPRPLACTAPLSMTTSRKRTEMADGLQDAPRHAGQVVRRVLLRRDIAIDAETAQLVANAVQAVLRARPAFPAAAPGPACSRRRLRAAVLIWRRLSARVPAVAG